MVENRRAGNWSYLAGYPPIQRNGQGHQFSVAKCCHKVKKILGKTSLLGADYFPGYLYAYLAGGCSTLPGLSLFICELRLILPIRWLAGRRSLPETG